MTEAETPVQEQTELLADVLENTVNEKTDINKAAAIRRAIQVLGGNAKPNDVVEYLKREHSVEVSAVYVSTIKGQMSRTATAQSFEAMRFAKRLVREVGSISAARQVLDALQNEQESLAETRNRYVTQLKDIDDRLTTKERAPLTNNEKRELLAEKRKVTKLLESLESL